MSDYTTRYFQLTSDILVEYNYATNKSLECKIDVNDLGSASVVTIDEPYIRHNVINKNVKGINLSLSNFVLPINKSQTKFLKLSHQNGITYSYEPPTNLNIKKQQIDYNNDDNGLYYMPFDKIRFHFTGRNFMGDYDGLIFQTFVYDEVKDKVCLMSFHLSKNDHITINDTPMLLNQRYYSSYIDVKIPSVYQLLKSYKYNTGIEDRELKNTFDKLKESLGINKNSNTNSGIGLLTNTPIMMNLFGVKHEINDNGYKYFLTENISKISIPSRDIYDDIYIDISEANDGDYFKIGVKVSDGTTFSDYISIMDEHPEAFIIIHELKLIEHYVDYSNKLKDIVTHYEQFILNAASTTTDTNNVTSSEINQNLNDEMLYRPICTYGSRCYKFTIQDTLKILNTSDNTTIVKTGAYTYDNPAKYGKKMYQINLTEIPPVINVYNKRVDTSVDTDTNVIRITNGGGGGTTIETNVNEISAFYEGTNIVVSVQQIPASYVETLG